MINIRQSKYLMCAYMNLISHQLNPNSRKTFMFVDRMGKCNAYNPFYFFTIKKNFCKPS